MTWVADSAINAEATADQPIKGSTLRKVQQNITAAFAGDSGAPALAAAVVGAAYGLLSLDSVGMHRLIISTQSNVASSPFPPANANTPGTTYSAASLGLAAGTWMHLGGGYVGFSSVPFDESTATYTYRYTNLFVRVA